LRDAGAESAALRSVGSMLPRTAPERRWFSAVALTAGVAEEVVYRGFGIAVLAAFAPWLPWWGLVLAAGAAFGLAHAYQGVAGILTTGLLGCVLAAVYLDTGSLLVPIVVHAAIDLRFLGVPADVLPGGGSAPEPAASGGVPTPGLPPEPGDPGPNDTRPIDFDRLP